MREFILLKGIAPYIRAGMIGVEIDNDIVIFKCEPFEYKCSLEFCVTEKTLFREIIEEKRKSIIIKTCLLKKGLVIQGTQEYIDSYISIEKDHREIIKVIGEYEISV